MNTNSKERENSTLTRRRTRSPQSLIFTFYTGSLHMTSCCLCSKVVNNISRKFNLCDCLVLGGAIVPCMFVGPAVLLDIYGDGYLSSGYGKQPCFPHIFPANLIFFSGPVLLSIAINFVCYYESSAIFVY